MSRFHTSSLQTLEVSLPFLKMWVSEKRKPGKFQREGTSEIYVLHLSAVCVNQRNLTELIVAVDVANLLQLYASMLFERRILIFASKLSTVCYLASAFTTPPKLEMLWEMMHISHHEMDTIGEMCCSESVSICSWHLACTRWVLYCIPCIGSTSSSRYCHHICWTTAGKIALHLFLCSLEKSLSVFKTFIWLQCTNALLNWGPHQFIWGNTAILSSNLSGL